MSAWTIPSYAEWAVPGYTEERQLGHGVSGRVVAAASERNGQPVAIKYFDASLVRDTEFLDEFRAEADRLRSLDAPHLVRLYDYVEQPGEGAAVVTQLVTGVSLREMIARRGALGPEAGLVVLKDALLALAAAHSLRVPHRDLKPDNVLIDARGWCTVTDFGVAVKPDKQMPAAGTPEYMAPELWDGEPSVPATDLYAAAAMLYESVTGRPPFSGRPVHLRDQHEAAAVNLDHLDQPLPDLIAWGMAKNPADRPRSARAYLSDVDQRAAAAYGPSWEDAGRRELGERTAELLPLLTEGGGSAASASATRRARRKIIGFASVAAVLLVVLVVGAAVALSGRSDTTQLSSASAAAFSAQVTVTPPVAASKCTAATTFTFSGTVTATQPETLSYQWVYSSGKPGAVETTDFAAAGHRVVSGAAVKAAKAGSGWGEIKILSPAAKASNKATYKLLCGTANGDIALSALVTPAAQSVSSCAAAAPSLTATGAITSKKAGTVSYYWALGNGQASAPATVKFAAAGTQTVAAYTFTPSALPASGDAVLVVTKPDAATSSPAAYSVSCTVPVTTTPSATPKTTAASSAKSSAAPSTAAPTTSAPATPAPTTTAPTTAAPTRTTPTSSAPTTSAPDTSTPTTSAPDTSTPTTSAPDTSTPTTSAPDTSTPTTTAPDTATPTTTAPDTTTPAS
jgi:serine/threonine-protein kinase